MFDQIENNTIQRRKDQELPRSSCSIQDQPVQKRVRFNYWQEPGVTKSPQKGISDRYLPIRKSPGSSKDLYIDYVQWRQEQGTTQKSQKKGISVADLYKIEVLGEGRHQNRDNDIRCFVNSNILKFHQQEDENKNQKFPSQGLFNLEEQFLPIKSQKTRKINKVPIKVLDAPALYDDFYLNLVDWSSTNLLSVGLSNSVYIWNASNSKVVRLVELSQNDLVTSNASSPSSNILGVGTHSGQVQLWDCVKNRKTFTYGGHSGRVGAISWNTNNILASGSRDKNILVRDTRVSSQYISKLSCHKQQVCGLKWSFDQQQLASGGNDNRLNIWNLHSTHPTASLLRHTAAVKALAWSPHQHGLLVSGGGTADRTIRFWNSITGEETKCLDVGSQVCNLMFAKTVNQLVSTHGYSLNQINIWRMPNMEKIETLTGHTFRVLYLAMNPDGTTIVTGAGDETLRFWSVFPKKEKEVRTKSDLNFESLCLR